MSAAFRKEMTAQRTGGWVHELLECGGEFECDPKAAIVEDWQHALMQAHTNAVEHMRFLSDPNDGEMHARCLRKDLARLAAVAEAMAENIKNL